MKILDVPGIALAGQQLIEASAGTGKTHAIANLFLRLVLEKGYRVDQVLVVTFTNAATDELRGRIRQRLATALQLLQKPEDIAGVGDDAFRRLLEAADGAADRAARVRHLEVQLSGMDDSAVFTINGFCQRVLAESAFESGQPFTAELSMETDLLLARAATDWWRRRFYTSPMLARLAAGDGNLCTPSALLARVRPLVGREVRIEHDEGTPERHAALVAQVRVAWRADRSDLLQQVADLTAAGMLSKADKTLRADRVEQAAREMDEFRADPHAALPGETGLRFRQVFLEECRSSKAEKQGVAAPAQAVTFLLDELQASHEALAQSLLHEAIEYCRLETDRLKRRDAVMGFDDQISRLHAALLGAGGDMLAARLAQRFPAALVDECQDTDPAQYAIFSRIYAGRDDTCLLMIGDPKQAIYSFRGADVFAYLGAKRATPVAGQHTLGTNWRSLPQLVAGVNALFGRRGADAFLYPDAIVFEPVAAAAKAAATPLLVNGRQPPALLFDIAPAPEGKKSGLHSKDEFQQLAATATAARIADLLAAARSGAACIGDQPLRLRDIAVLVRSHREGALIQETLRRAGIASAIASQDSVFAGAEAAALQHVLAAIADPASDGLLRRALVSEAWRANAAEVERIRSDEAAADALRNRVAAYHATWMKQGFMPMFRAWLHGERIPERLWQGGQGERAMSNLLQLAELLQAASRAHPAPEALLKHLAATRAAGRTEEAHQLRLESDENLVQVVTLHKSKGLQYPVVFLPFLACGRDDSKDRPPILWHEESGALVCSLREDGAARREARREQLAEDLRLAYVGLTRAQYQCVVGWGAVTQGDKSALGWLLLGADAGGTGGTGGNASGEKGAGNVPDIAAWRAAAARLDHEARCAPVRELAAQHADSIALANMPDKVTPLPASPVATTGWRVQHMPRTVSQAWRQTSYSALADARDDNALAWHGRAREDVALPLAGPAVAVRADDIASFPRGREAGTFFHAVMEHLDFTQARGEVLRGVVERQLARHGIAAHWRDTIERTVGAVLDTPIDDNGFTLRGIPRERRRDECEFCFPLRDLRADRLEALLPGLPEAGEADGSRLQFRPVNGILRGFIDLIFEHEGRWYLADWKTNWLGTTPEHYRAGTLHAAMREHRYDLQYSLYTVALHRYLKQRLPAYDAARDFGGVYYFFVRGMRPENGPATGVFFRRATAADIAALDAVVGALEVA